MKALKDKIIFRSIRFNYKEETEVVGVSAYKYALDEILIANKSTIADNECFNPFPDTKLVHRFDTLYI